MKYNVSDLSIPLQVGAVQSCFSRALLRNLAAVNEPGLQIQCDACMCDLTHSIRIKCADPMCEPGDGVDICPACFCAGKEFAKHKRGHAYRVIVSQDVEALTPLQPDLVFSQELHSYPIFSEDWGADEYVILSHYHLRRTSCSRHARELLLIEGISKAGLGNWQMIAEHVGTRTKEEVEEHYNSVYVDSADWPLPVSY